MPAHLVESIESGRDLLGRRPLAIIALDLFPAHVPARIENEHRRVRNAIFFFAAIIGIAQAVTIDGAAARIRKQSESQWSAAVGRDLRSERTALRRNVAADRVDAHVTECAREIAKSDQLPDAVRSPVAAIEHEHDFVAASRRKSRDVIVFIDELEFGCEVTDPGRRSGGGRESQRRDEQQRSFHGTDLYRTPVHLNWTALRWNCPAPSFSSSTTSAMPSGRFTFDEFILDANAGERRRGSTAAVTEFDAFCTPWCPCNLVPDC